VLERGRYKVAATVEVDDRELRQQERMNGRVKVPRRPPPARKG
jgi:hypothetical protein